MICGRSSIGRALPCHGRGSRVRAPSPAPQKMYKKVEITNQFKLTKKQKQLLSDLAHDLTLIKKSASFLDDIVVRGGFLLDVLLNSEPFDVDLLYTTKEQIGKLFSKCRCEELRNAVKDLDFKVMVKKYEIDFGHFGLGELYMSPTDKTVGFHSHQKEINSQLSLDSDGRLWSNARSIQGIKDKVHEVRFEGWLLYPYFIREFPHIDYYFNFTSMCLRGLKMIYTKKYKSVGPNYRNMLDNARPILDFVLTVPQYLTDLKKYYKAKCRNMSKQEIRKALKVTKANNQEYLYKTFVRMLF